MIVGKLLFRISIKWMSLMESNSQEDWLCCLLIVSLPLSLSLFRSSLSLISFRRIFPRWVQRSVLRQTPSCYFRWHDWVSALNSALYHILCFFFLHSRLSSSPDYFAALSLPLLPFAPRLASVCTSRWVVVFASFFSDFPFFAPSYLSLLTTRSSAQCVARFNCSSALLPYFG